MPKRREREDDEEEDDEDEDEFGFGQETGHSFGRRRRPRPDGWDEVDDAISRRDDLTHRRGDLIMSNPFEGHKTAEEMRHETEEEKKRAERARLLPLLNRLTQDDLGLLLEAAEHDRAASKVRTRREQLYSQGDIPAGLFDELGRTEDVHERRKIEAIQRIQPTSDLRVQVLPENLALHRRRLKDMVESHPHMIEEQMKFVMDVRMAELRRRFQRMVLEATKKLVLESTQVGDMGTIDTKLVDRVTGEAWVKWSNVDLVRDSPAYGRLYIELTKIDLLFSRKNQRGELELLITRVTELSSDLARKSIEEYVNVMTQRRDTEAVERGMIWALEYARAEE